MLVANVAGCNGCPLYGDGERSFTPDTVTPHAQVVVVTSPGVKIPRIPGITMTVQRVPRCGAKSTGKVGSDGLRFCQQAHGVSGDVVVALGQNALTALGVKGRITELRGLALDMGPRGAESDQESRGRSKVDNVS